tara:strand:+ start:2563 stop:2883 length:321 start_codon:yes stop_codon:yes gene_type:complete
MISQIKTSIITLICTLFLWLGIGTVFYYNVENWSWITSFYFSVTTLSTVGYGEFYPTTELSRLFTSIYILLGVGIMLSSLTFIGTKYLKKKEENILRRRIKKIRDQ